MKRLLLLLTFVTTLLVSCDTSAQIVYEKTNGYTTEYVYYDGIVGTTIVYIDRVPYYRYMYENRWVYTLVPRERWGYIRMREPIYYNHYRHQPIPKHDNKHNNFEHGKVDHKPNVQQPNKPNVSTTKPQIMNGGNRGGNVNNQNKRQPQPKTRGGRR